MKLYDVLQVFSFALLQDFWDYIKRQFKRFSENPHWKNTPILNFFRSVFVIFLSCVWFFYVIFKIMLYFKLNFSLVEFNLATLCNLLIWKYLSLTIGYFGIYWIVYFALLGVINYFFYLNSRRKVSNILRNLLIRSSVAS